MTATTNPNYIYVSPDKRVKIILAESDEYGNVRISGDVRSDSRPEYHHTEIIVNGNCLRWSCSCEAGAHGYLCRHVTELFNVYRKNAKKLGVSGGEEDE